LDQPDHAGDRHALLVNPDGRVVPLHLLGHVPGQRAPHDSIDVRSVHEVGERTAQAVDQAYKMVCGKDMPASARGIAISSAGPDRKLGTSDDIKSWE
jgi:hypothetical protein